MKITAPKGSILGEIQHQTLTYDRGSEMARHAELTQRVGLNVYFADPYSPWQRGTNENTNGIIRRYLPKGMDLSGVSQQELDAIAYNMNTCPRKALGYRTPMEVFVELLEKAQLGPDVANQILH